MTDCCICLESTNRENIYTMSSCSHWTCKTCFQQLQQQAQEDRKSYIRCPMCRSREDISRPSRHARSRHSRQSRHSTPRRQRPSTPRQQRPSRSRHFILLEAFLDGLTLGFYNEIIDPIIDPLIDPIIDNGQQMIHNMYEQVRTSELFRLQIEMLITMWFCAFLFNVYNGYCDWSITSHIIFINGATLVWRGRNYVVSCL